MSTRINFKDALLRHQNCIGSLTMKTLSIPHAGEVLRKYRQEQELSLSQVAKKLGNDWDKSRVSKYERGQAVTLQMLEKFSAALDVPMEVLLLDCLRLRYKGFEEVSEHVEKIIEHFSSRT